jgi:hypothetical protein
MMHQPRKRRRFYTQGSDAIDWNLEVEIRIGVVKEDKPDMTQGNKGNRGRSGNMRGEDIVARIALPEREAAGRRRRAGGRQFPVY